MVREWVSEGVVGWQSEVHSRLSCWHPHTLENAPEAIYVHTEGVYRFVNAAILGLYGAGWIDQLLDSPILERVHPDHRQAVMERCRLLYQEERRVPVMEQKHFRLDGSTVNVED